MTKTKKVTTKKVLPVAYNKWIADLKRRYRATQIKAAVAVNSALIEFYWNLGKDIRNRFAGSAGYGSNFFRRLNVDLTEEFPNVRGFSERNLKYCLDFYDLYCESEILQQPVAKSKRRMPEVNLQQVVADLICVPWGHHCILIDKCKGHNRVLAKFHLEKLGLPMGISDYEIKKVLPTPAQLAKCYADAEAQVAKTVKAESAAESRVLKTKKGVRHG